MPLIPSKWPREISQIRLPRPTILKIKLVNAAPAENELLDNYQSAAHMLKTISAHQIERWEVVARYANSFGTYNQVLATYAALKDPLFLRPFGEIKEAEREQHVARLLGDPDTTSHGLAASLCGATHIAALATALTAFAVNNPSRQSFMDARNSTEAADRYLFEFERLEARYS